MKGLLVKDVRLLLRQKMTLVVIVALGIFMSLNGGNPSFSLGYMMVVSAMLVINTISYDYFENGMSFLLTMPIRRFEYVVEKYVLALLVELFMAVVAVVIQVGGLLVTGTADWKIFLGTAIGCMVTATLILAMYIPVNLKFGPEKSRIALLILIGAIAAISYVVYKVEPLQRMLIHFGEMLIGLTAAQLVCLAVGVWLLVMCISVLVSIRIMEKKEF